MLEPDIKVALAQRLLERGELAGDAVLINEFAVGDWSRRADFAIANGRLQAFEVKSAADSLVRLDGQLETYLKLFDKVTVAAAPCHIDSVLQKAPDEVSVVKVDLSRVKIVRRGRVQEIRSPSALISLLLVREMKALLRARGVRVAPRDGRDELEAKASKLPVSVLRSAVLCGIKSRYRRSFDRFRNAVMAQGEVSLSSLRLLRAWEPEAESEGDVLRERVPAFPEETVALDLEKFRQAWGYVPDRMPRRVMARRT